MAIKPKPPAHEVLVSILQDMTEHLKDQTAYGKALVVMDALVRVLCEMHIPDNGRAQVAQCFRILAEAAMPYAKTSPVAADFVDDLPVLARKILNCEDFRYEDYFNN